MPNKNYVNGRAFEYKVRDEWKARGYEALRSAGSHSPYDVIAIKPVETAISIQSELRNGIEYITYTTRVEGYAIQCKRRKVK